MSYLKLPRARLALWCFLISSAVLVEFSSIDLRVSRLFYSDAGFYLADQWWSLCLHECAGNLIGLSMVLVASLYLFNRFSKRNLLGVDGRKLVFLLAVLVLGAGLIVNVLFKDHFGRARPRNVLEFGGSQRFTPAFVVANECARNCSFSSGEGAGAFFSLALASAFGRKRSTLLIGLGFGCLVSVSRIASGAHFLSDTVVSFFVMSILTDVLAFYLLSPTHRLLREAPAAITAPSIGAANPQELVPDRLLGYVD